MRQIQIVIASLAFLLGALVSAEPRQLSTDLDDRAMIHELLEWIVASDGPGGYTAPGIEPVLIRLSPTAMGELVCGRESCPVFGFHHTGSYVIVVVRGMAPEAERAVIVHELVHYLQSRASPVWPDCVEDYAREREAYQIQNRYRYQVQGYRGPAAIPRVVCAP